MKKIYLVLPLTVLLLTGCKQEELLKGLDQNQANDVIALLQRNNILAMKKGAMKEGFSVSVEPRDFAAAVDLMATYGLPRQPDMEIAQMFPADSLVSSPRAEKARLYSGIEQRLAQSLLSIQGIVSARVHVSYDFDAGEGERKKKPVHLSSLLNYDNRIVDTTLLIGDVKRFLKNSFDDIDYDNISVVLSKVDNVQRIPPVASSASSPSHTSWLLIGGLLILSLMMFFMLFVKKGNHSLATKLKGRHGFKKEGFLNKTETFNGQAPGNKNSTASVHENASPEGDEFAVKGGDNVR
ncbi:EscJ/YscJ/HrcJ family type III secretion inner membrane ring protein [Erwinia tasmaniensis]|uniref:EscJ/YscJ/HrcJ family type III secretion inner membrane ring protein n=1 Tax=Erwinia tasmaniensis TaxID=338565 RepID=UPI003A4DDB7B